MMRLTVDVLRKFIQDTPMMNKIFAGIEFQNKDYETAIAWGDLKQGGIPPFINDFSASSIPVDIQRIGALASLFEMAALYTLRNMSNLSEAGVVVPVGENAIVYERLSEKYEKKYVERVNLFKIKINIENQMEQCFQGGVYGPYDNGDGI